MAYSQAVIISLILPKIYCFTINSKFNLENITNTSHLDSTNVKSICNNRDSICKSNGTHVCTVRYYGGQIQYSDFENSCYLFLSNMCDFPGEEYHIIEGIRCESFLRRNQRSNGFRNFTEETTSNSTVFYGTTTTARPLLRAKEVSKLYDIDTAFDDHACPLSCHDTYSPVCVSANRGAGKYFKFFTFINHCFGDVYYCKHFDEFAPPPDADEEDVNVSGLSWSYCGAFRYMQFARFSEALSSLGHYGWLAGDQRYSHIMEPQERKPGYG